MNSRDVAGVVFGIQRFSLDDGPGTRTVVFLKGCSLRCRWCHNPESLDPRPTLSCLASRCVGCGDCAGLCPAVHSLHSGIHYMERENCLGCGRCVEACPGRALSLVGQTMTADEVMATVRRDRRFYRDGGGLTLSGGEPTGQSEFAEALLRLCRHAGIATAIETNGAAPAEIYRRLVPLVDLFLWDIKDTDPERHRHNTGIGSEAILANLRMVGEAGGKLVLRCPLVPGANDTPEHRAGLATLAATTPGVVGAQVMPYHRLAAGKADRFGLPEGELFDPPEAEVLREWEEALAAGLRQKGA